MAPAPLPLSAQTLLQLGRPLAPERHPQTARSLPGLVALGSAAIPPCHPLDQVVINIKMYAWMKPKPSMSPSPSALACLMAFRFQQGPTVTPLNQHLLPSPPTITSTPLGPAGPRQGQTFSDDSRPSLASLYTSLYFNVPGYLVVGLGNMTPLAPSIAESHHVSSTWLHSVVTPRVPPLCLTIDQTQSVFRLVAECQVLNLKLTKEFQVLLGLEAIHHNSIQVTAHKTLMLGCSAQEAAYSSYGMRSLRRSVRPPYAAFTLKGMPHGRRYAKS